MKRSFKFKNTLTVDTQINFDWRKFNVTSLVGFTIHISLLKDIPLLIETLHLLYFDRQYSCEFFRQFMSNVSHYLEEMRYVGEENLYISCKMDELVTFVY